MLEPYDGKLSRTVLRREGGGNTANPADYYPLVKRLHGQVIHIGPASTQYINPMDINSNYSEEDNPLALKADFILPVKVCCSTATQFCPLLTTSRMIWNCIRS